ncbi:chemosensory receptor A [Elysia marginata]|uniref:Chemosensory receptor A n=1 Tax=Elysia marginata TaxID=1093978 RepID=A0AAV4HEQ2_9GAST|nr:chemosensory receptor A [Elysia marginata]
MENLNLNSTAVLNFTEEQATPPPSMYQQAALIVAGLWPIIVVFGIFANILNIILFLKVGAKDNVTILLIALSTSDLAFLLLITPTVSGHFTYYIVRPSSWPFDRVLLNLILYWPAYTAFDLSSYISVTLGVMRCACVAMPLRFKLVFTKARTLKWLVFLVFTAVALRIPVLMVNRVAWRRDPVTNVTAPYLATVNRDFLYKVGDILNRVLVINFTYVTMIACLFILSFKLYQSSKMRRSLALQTPQATDKTSKKPAGVQTMSSRDLQVVKSVALVCTIFVITQLPYVVSSTIRLAYPVSSNKGSLSLVLMLMFRSVNGTCSYLNASVNIFVYYNYNSKYRSVFCSTLCLSAKQKEKDESLRFSSNQTA